MKKIISLQLILPLLLGLFSSPLFADGFSNTEVYTFTAENGTPVFTDQKAKLKEYETKIIQAVKAEDSGNGYYPNIPPMQAPVHQVTNVVIHNHVSNNDSGEKKTSLSTCRSYKRKLDAVSEKMRVGYTASQYRSLEKRRVKYRDLLFNKCDRHELL